MTSPMIGLWWLPEVPERRVSGSLEQAPDGQFTLQTYSGLEDEDAVSGGQQAIYGSVNGFPVTMRGVQWWGSQGHERDTLHEKWVSRSVLSGLHLDEEQRFESLDIESEYLDGWVDRHLWEYSIRNNALAIADYPGAETATFGGGGLSLRFGTSQQLGQKTWSITRSTGLTVRTSTPMTIGSCIDQAQHFDSLLDLVFETPTAASHVRVRTVDAGRIPLLGYILMGAASEPRYADPGKRLRAVADSLCTFDDLGGLEGLAKWFALEPQYRYLSGRITSHYRGEGRYLEDRALTAFAAGEALDRAESQTSQSTAKTRWKRLAEKIPEFTNDFIGLSVDDWAGALVKQRDDLAHVLTTQAVSAQDGARLIALTQSAHFLSILSLLRIAGLERAIATMPSGHRWLDEKRSYQNTMRSAGLL